MTAQAREWRSATPSLHHAGEWLWRTRCRSPNGCGSHWRSSSTICSSSPRTCRSWGSRNLSSV